MIKKIFLVMIFGVFCFGASTFSDPKPTFENPRKVVVWINENNLEKANHTIGSIYNILKEYPAESLKVAVVLYSGGMRIIKKDADSKILERIKSLMNYDVEFYGCRNTMETMGWKDEDFIDDIIFVQAGIVEVVEKQVEGYYAIKPY